MEDPEQCDDDNNISGDGCSDICIDEDGISECGNDIWEQGEQCEDGNTISGDGCSDICEIEDGGDDGDGGGGGGDSNPTVGTCSIHSSTNAWQCVPRYPVEDVDEPTYIVYRDCEEDPGKTVRDCLIEWAESKDFSVCGDEIGGQIEVPYTGSLDVDLIAQCDRIIYPPGGGGGCNPSLGSSIEKEVRRISGVFDEEAAISRGEKVTYRISLTVGGNDVPTISSGKIRVYDFIIPAESGHIWNREGIITSDWDWNVGGRYYERALTGVEVSILNANGTINPYFDYVMDSELAVYFDVANLQNVAFAVIEYTGGAVGIGGACNAFNRYLEDVFSDSTLGDTANVKLVRPFVEARGGDVAFRFSENTQEELVPGDPQSIIGEAVTSGRVFVETLLSRFQGVSEKVTEETLTEIEEFSGMSADVFYENLKLNQKDTSESFSGILNAQFKTTKDEGGVYFVEGDGAPATSSGGTTVLDMNGQSKTFIIDNGKDFEIRGDLKISNGYAAFIVRNGGNIIVSSGVTNIAGVFIVEDGEIRPPTTLLSSFESSVVPLNVSGMLVGNIGNLFRYRQYIGVDPDVELEPNVEVSFDLRLLENTPPALERALGEGWRQGIGE